MHKYIYNSFLFIKSIFRKFSLKMSLLVTCISYIQKNFYVHLTKFITFYKIITYLIIYVLTLLIISSKPFLCEPLTMGLKVGYNGENWDIVFNVGYLNISYKAFIDTYHMIGDGNMERILVILSHDPETYVNYKPVTIWACCFGEPVNSQPSIDQSSVNSQPSIDQSSVNSQPSIDQSSVNSQPSSSEPSSSEPSSSESSSSESSIDPKLESEFIVNQFFELIKEQINTNEIPMSSLNYKRKCVDLIFNSGFTEDWITTDLKNPNTLLSNCYDFITKKIQDPTESSHSKDLYAHIGTSMFITNGFSIEVLTYDRVFSTNFYHTVYSRFRES